MIKLDDGLDEGFLTYARDHVTSVERDLLAIEKSGAAFSPESINGTLQAMHSLEVLSGFLGLTKIGELAQRTHNLLAFIQARKIPPTANQVQILLRATDKLGELIETSGMSNEADIKELTDALVSMCPQNSGPPSERKPLRMLVVEDDFSSRLVLQTFLSRFGECHVAVNGKEAVEAFQRSLQEGSRYDLICMDIMMPEMDGREALEIIRRMEEAHGIRLNYGAKIIMTTAVDDIRKVFQCFKALCDAYLIKPIDLGDLLGKMKSYDMVQ